MLPIRDSVVKRYPAVITWTLIVINILCFLFMISLPQSVFERFILTFALIPARYFGELKSVKPPDDLISYLPFLTNMFLHGGWMHLIINMWTFYIFGPAVEDRLGSVRFFFFYIICGLISSFAHGIANSNSTVPALGASGAISGVIGCYVRMFPFARIVLMVPVLFLPFFVEVYAIFFAFFWFITQMIPGIISLMLPANTGGIAWWAHIGGFFAGWVICPFIRCHKRVYRRLYADEGCYGFFPNGNRAHRGGRSWV